ncbi:hypothetical protein [Bradyrhizobium sp. USDA 4502]
MSVRKSGAREIRIGSNSAAGRRRLCRLFQRLGVALQGAPCSSAPLGRDGSLFFPDALQRGYGATFEQYGGYFHALPRLLSATFVHLPLEQYALLINLSCLAIYAAAASLLARRSHRSLLPSDGLRVTGAVALCFLPGLCEVLGNVANLHSAVFLAAMLLSLKDLDSPLRKWEVALLLFIGATAGEVMVLLPVFILRSYLRWHRNDGLQVQAMEWSAVTIMLGWALLNSYMASANNLQSDADVQLYALTAVSTLSARFLLQPLLGDKQTLWMYSHLAIMTSVSLALFAVLAWRLLASRNRMVPVLVLAAFCAWAILPLTWIVRPGSITLHPFLRPPNLSVFEHRYAWTGTPLAVVLWLVVVQHWEPPRRRPSLATGLTLLMIVFIWHRGELTPFGTEQDWRATLAKLRSVHPGQFGEAPENPEGWKIVVKGPVP